MGKPTGFLEYKRREPGYRPREERVRDFNGVEKRLSYNAVQVQAARCMDCGTPFCHAVGCPLSNLIPEFNDFVFRGNWRKALDLLMATNNFPEFTGRLCPAPCEAACVEGINDGPVTIRQVELSLIEKGFEDDYLRPMHPVRRHKKKVAVIGGGPSGLAAADTINKAGYQVVVFDEAPNPGGILRYGIPDFKMQKWVVERRVHMMKEEGIVFESGVKVGEDVSYRFLRNRFDALCLACGAREGRDLPVPGRDLEGIHFAMDYLVQQNRRVGGERLDSSGEIWAGGRKVVIIGGGDTGSDCLGTALRQGAASVVQLEILPKPPKLRPDYTPWPTWPHIRRESHAHKEGGDIRWSVMTKSFLGREERVTGVACMEVEWERDPDGTLRGPSEKPGSDFLLEADLVFLATGFTGPEKNRIVEDLGIEKDARGNIRAGFGNMTNVPGIFVAGDMSLGQSLVVRAIASGREAGRGVCAYLEKS